MSIQISFLEVPNLVDRVVRPQQIQRAEADSVAFSLNRNKEITQYNAVKYQFTYQVEGLNSDEVFALQNLVEQNLQNLLFDVPPLFVTVAYSGLIYRNCFLRRVNPTGPIIVGDLQIIEQTELVFETTQRYLA